MHKVGGLQDCVGKTIVGAILKQKKEGASGGVEAQICLVFMDNTWLEIWVSDGVLGLPNSLDSGDHAKARRYMAGAMDILFEAYMDDDGRLVIKDNSF